MSTTANPLFARCDPKLRRMGSRRTMEGPDYELLTHWIPVDVTALQVATKLSVWGLQILRDDQSAYLVSQLPKQRDRPAG